MWKEKVEKFSWQIDGGAIHECDFRLINGIKYVPERTCKMMKVHGDDGYTFVCSECNRPISYFAKDRYCPHCGAKVVGD